MKKLNSVSSQISPAEYAEFIKQIEPINITLLEAEMRNYSFLKPDSTREVRLTTRSRYENREGLIDGYQTYTATLKDPSTKEKLAHFVVTFIVTYESKIPMSGEIFSIFQHNLYLNTWPYLREFLHSNSGKMNLVPLIAPAFKAGIPKTESMKSALKKGD